MMFLRFVLLAVATCTLASHLPAQDFKRVFRRAVQENFKDPVLDAPDGYRLLSQPSPRGEEIRSVAGPTSIEVTGYVENEGNRYYLTGQSFYDWLGGKAPKEWISISNTGRAEFINKTTPAKLIGAEVRKHFKFGETEAEIYEETVTLQNVTVWSEQYRRAEVDFLLPVKVEEFTGRDNGEWEVAFSVFPNFASETSRIPGPSDGNDEGNTALITKPAQEKILLSGTSSASEMDALFEEGMVFAASMSEGRIQRLKVGGLYPPYVNTSALSAPQFSNKGALAFRFNATRLNAEPSVIEVTPEKITGADMTDYSMIAMMGPPFGEQGMPEWIHDEWSIEIGPDMLLKVVAPLTEGRGAAGMLELEGLALEEESTYQRDLEALVSFDEQTPPKLPPSSTGGWQSILHQQLGPVPATQQIQP